MRRYYRLRGYRIVGANVRAGGNEVDIVARRGQRLVICEVKTRNRLDYGDPWEMVGLEKERRVRRAAEGWIARHPELAGLEVACEVIAVRGRKLDRITF